MFLDAYFFAIVVNYFLWKGLMTYVQVYLYGFTTFLLALPAVRFVTGRLGAVATVSAALSCYLVLILLISLAKPWSTAGRIQVWSTLPFVSIACGIIPAFQSILYSQYPVDARAEIISWYKMMGIGIPKALGSTAGGAILSLCVRRDPKCSNYLVGIAPHAPLVLGTLALLAIFCSNERNHGHESLYVATAPAGSSSGGTLE